MTIGGDGTSKLEQEITQAVRELRFCVQWSYYQEYHEEWFDTAGEVIQFLVDHRRGIVNHSGYGPTTFIMGRNLTEEDVRKEANAGR